MRARDLCMGALLLFGVGVLVVAHAATAVGGSIPPHERHTIGTLVEAVRSASTDDWGSLMRGMAWQWVLFLVSACMATAVFIITIGRRARGPRLVAYGLVSLVSGALILELPVWTIFRDLLEDPGYCLEGEVVGDGELCVLCLPLWFQLAVVGMAVEMWLKPREGATITDMLRPRSAVV